MEREYTQEQLEKMVTSDNTEDRETAARNCVGLDVLIDDPESLVRWEVACQGYGLAKLVDDDDPRVREEVAWQGYGHEKLKDDPVYRVRNAVKRYQEIHAAAKE